MKTYFVINPLAGKGDKFEKLKKDISMLSDCEIYYTKSGQDGEEFVRNICKNNKDEKIRFVACGGDGTINNVFSGTVGYDNVSVSVFPCGSGNDFVKNFPKSTFDDVKKLVAYDEMEMDIMRVNDHYSFNVTSFGFDTTVAIKVNEDRKKNGHGSKFSYALGIVKALVNSMDNYCKIYADGELLNPDGHFLLCTVANGGYVGGSFHCAPKAILDDGYLEVCMVKRISRLKLISLIKCYIDGVHLDDPRFDELLEYRRAKKISLEAKDGFAYSLDGEIKYEKNVEIELIPLGIKLGAKNIKKY